MNTQGYYLCHHFWHTNKFLVMKFPNFSHYIFSHTKNMNAVRFPFYHLEHIPDNLQKNLSSIYIIIVTKFHWSLNGHQKIAEKFIPSHMEEVFVQQPKAITVQRRTQDDISREQQPLIIPQEAPDTQRAQIAYYRSGQPQVPSYNL